MPWSLAIHHIDLGRNGDSTVIVATDGNTTKTVLIDGGKNASTDVVNTYIGNLNVPTVDVIVVTHYDDDHFGGIVGLLSLTNVAGRYDHAIIFDQGVPPNSDKFNSQKRNGNGELKQLYPRYREKIGEMANATRITAQVNSFEIVSFDQNWDPVIPVQANQQAINGRNYWPANWLVGKEIMWGNDQTGNNYQSNPPVNAPTIHCIAANKYVQRAGGINFVSEFGRFLGVNRDDTVDAENANDNTKSLAFLVQFGNFRYYIGGDIESTQEDGSVDRKSNTLPTPVYTGIKDFLNQTDTVQDRIMVMKTSHHGSAKSSSRLFLNRMRPGTAIISNSSSRQGRNHFDHPAARVVNCLDGYASNPILSNQVQTQFQHPPQPPAGAQTAIPGFMMRNSAFRFNGGTITSALVNQNRTPGHTQIQVSAVQAAVIADGQIYQSTLALINNLANLLNVNVLNAAAIANAAVTHGVAGALAQFFGLTATVQQEYNPISQTQVNANTTWSNITSALAWAGLDNNNIGVVQTAYALAQANNTANAITQAISQIDNGARTTAIGAGSAAAIGVAFTNGNLGAVQQAALNAGANQATATAAAAAALALRNGIGAIQNVEVLPSVGYAIAAAFGAMRTANAGQAALMAVAQTLKSAPILSTGIFPGIPTNIVDTVKMDWIYNAATVANLAQAEAALAAGIAVGIQVGGNFLSVPAIARHVLTLGGYGGDINQAVQVVQAANPLLGDLYNVVYRTVNQPKSF